MRHQAFFTELAALRGDDPSWRAVTAGLVVLRLVDAWVEEGSRVVAADSWGVRSVRAAIEDMTGGLERWERISTPRRGGGETHLADGCDHPNQWTASCRS